MLIFSSQMTHSCLPGTERLFIQLNGEPTVLWVPEFMDCLMNVSLINKQKND
jgi:hypothetical protein